MKQPIISSSWSCCFRNISSEPADEMVHNEPEKKNISHEAKIKTGGWRAISFILGNETFERLASFGLLANFMVYLTTELHMDQVSASNIMNIWSGVNNFAPLVGAFISDAYAGRFWTIGFASFASLSGMATVTLTAWLPQLHPSACTKQELDLGHCRGPSQTQLGSLLLGLGFLSIGTGGIRPCSIPFGVDQFDPTTDQGRKGINSFFNWYYTTFTIVLLITQTVVVYIQDNLSWVVGFGIPTILMACSIAFFFIGTSLYNHAKPEGSMFSSILQVFVAAYKKRRIILDPTDDIIGADDHHDHKVVFYEPPVKGSVLSKLSRTNQYRFLDKAAVITENDLQPNSTPTNKWRLCSIQQVEEVKCLVRITPIWVCGMISLTSMVQQWTFTISQALKMDRHLGPTFLVPAGSISVISLLTIALFLPFYDRFLVPALRRITGHDTGITLLQRMGIGIVFSTLSMVVAGLIEKERRTSANNPHYSEMSVFWLSPQLILMGLCEAFNIIGQIEFFNRQFPENMRSVGNALFSCSFAGASYISTLMVTLVHSFTGTKHRPDWLTNDINRGRLDYFYFLIALVGVLNLVSFLYCAKRYRYKGSASGVEMDDQKAYVDVEMSPVKA
ncbi:Nitrate transporter 1.7 [Morus notabilis]|uniref:Nitrate transporter 1.7 n=1 Tax=Morus notabilis TaxID=981085 RepID=W9R1B4_9ROSA|nr:protein NRT1/ PTR FAMILY 2.13 [Morus notabilis]EXB63800.1 Nitrate transporter 1.7 [Morus notabilis]